MRSRLSHAFQQLPGWWRARSFFLAVLAALHRRQLVKVTFVAITGSAGKSTAMFMSNAVLGTAGKIRPNTATLNDFDHINSLVVATQPGDDFCVVEVSGSKPEALDRPLALVRPRIGVVTAVGTDHLKAFHSAQAIAREKSKVVECLPPDGTAVLNADDSLVLDMAKRSSAKIISFGRNPQAMLRAENISSVWPDRLSFTAHYEDKAVVVRSRLCGTHWISSLLAALAVGVAAGIPLEQSAKAIEGVEPHPSRMYPVFSDDGVTFVMDDWKSSLWTFPAVFDFLRVAQARRKIMIIGTLSDYGGAASRAYLRTARTALEVADHVIFVGPMASHVLRIKRQGDTERLHAFAAVKSAAMFLRSFLVEGDLVLLKASMNADHLGRLAHDWLEPISCWRMDCRKNMRCDRCPVLRAGPERVRPRQPVNDPRTDAVDELDGGSPSLSSYTGPFEVIVGIGNPGARYRNTPHNVGFEVLDALARRLGREWAAYEDFVLAFLKLNERTLLLVKPQRYVNHTGECLKALADELGFSAKECVLVHDDIHLLLGKLRSRARGSDGGHKGVRSLLMAFQTGEFRRLKIGVAPADAEADTVKYLVSPFATEATATIERAIDAAAERLLTTLRDELPDVKSARAPEAPRAPTGEVQL